MVIPLLEAGNLRQTGGHAVELRLSGPQVHAGLQPSDDGDFVIPVALEQVFRICRRKEKLHGNGLDVLSGRPKPGGHHTDHLIGLRIERDRPAKDCLVAAQAVLPEAVGQYHHAISAFAIFCFGECAAEFRRDPEHREVVCRHGLSGDALRRAQPGEVHGCGVHSGQPFECRGSLAIVHQIGWRNSSSVAGARAAQRGAGAVHTGRSRGRV